MEVYYGGTAPVVREASIPTYHSNASSERDSALRGPITLQANDERQRL